MSILDVCNNTIIVKLKENQCMVEKYKRVSILYFINYVHLIKPLWNYC